MGWEAYEMRSGPLSLSLVPALGGRIMSLQFHGEEFFFVQEEHAGELFDFSRNLQELDRAKRAMGFRVWGGDKTWVAPQKAWRKAIPPLTLDAGRYEIVFQAQEKKVQMQSALDPETGLQILRELRFLSERELELKQSFYNGSNSKKKWGIWNVSQILRNIYVHVPVEAKELRPYPEEGDSEKLHKLVIKPSQHAWSRIQCEDALHFKYGARVPIGHLAIFKSSKKRSAFLVMERFFSVEPEAPYAHDAIVEVYNSPSMNYAEVEVHAPIHEIAPGQTISHSQRWRFSRVTKERMQLLAELPKSRSQN